MLPDGRRLGAHLALGSGMVKAVERAHRIGADAMQIFTDNPTSWRRRAEPPKELPAFRERIAEHGIGPIAIHAAYLINLAGPEPKFFEQSIDILARELRGAPTFGAAFVNVHIGSHRDAGLDFGIERVAEAIDLVLRQVDDGLDAARLVLENSAGSGWGVGVDLDELARIADAVGARGISETRVGFCLDTAHAWGAGIDLRDADVVDDFLEIFDRRIGAQRLAMVHLNDSRAELGSRNDRHEHIGAGLIGAVGIGNVLCHPLLGGATYYLETPGMDVGFDAINIERVYRIAAGQPLPELPAEAFDLGPSDRGRTPPA